MKLHSMGINYRHESDFIIERPTGSGDNLLIIFKTDAYITLNGIKKAVSTDSAIVYSKGFPQFYSAKDSFYSNHWVHFELDEDDEFLKAIKLPFNTIIEITDINSVENLLLQLSSEDLSENSNKEQCKDLLLRLIIAKLCELRQKGTSKGVHSEKLMALRNNIYASPSEQRSISDIACSLSLSPSHFQALYKAQFGVSCYDDILTARIKMAKYYLRNTALPVGRIAQLCGYENDVHFIRQFRKKTGITASGYRKKHI